MGDSIVAGDNPITAVVRNGPRFRQHDAWAQGVRVLCNYVGVYTPYLVQSFGRVGINTVSYIRHIALLISACSPIFFPSDHGQLQQFWWEKLYLLRYVLSHCNAPRTSAWRCGLKLRTEKTCTHCRKATRTRSTQPFRVLAATAF